MINHTTALLALRTQTLTLSVVTTGSATLDATTTGYHRSSGSFLTDGLAVGMEFTPTGFAVNAAHVITAVTATTVTTPDTIAVEAAGAGRTLAVGLPAIRAWENLTPVNGTAPISAPVAGRWYVEEDYLPGPAAQVTVGPLGQIEVLPLYVLKLYGLANTGVTALYKAADALLTLFAPRTSFTVASGDSLTVRTNPAPFRGQLMQADPGWAVVTVTIPLRLRSPNSY